MANARTIISISLLLVFLQQHSIFVKCDSSRCDSITPASHSNPHPSCMYCSQPKVAEECKEQCQDRGCGGKNGTQNSNDNRGSNPGKCNDIEPCTELKDANAKFVKCCSEKGIKKSCWDKCRYDVKKREIQDAFLHDVCELMEAQDFLSCAANNKDNRNCCKVKKVTEGDRAICEPFCNPNGDSWPEKADSKFGICFSQFDAIMTCHWAAQRPDDVKETMVTKEEPPKENEKEKEKEKSTEKKPPTSIDRIVHRQKESDVDESKKSDETGKQETTDKPGKGGRRSKEKTKSSRRPRGRGKTSPAPKLTTIASNSRNINNGGTGNCNDVDPCVDLETANKKFQDCCKGKQMKDTCIPKCRYDLKKKEIQDAFMKHICELGESRDYLYCAASNKDNNYCCKQKHVTDGDRSICEPFCNPASDKWPTKAEAKYLKCLGQFDDIMACHYAAVRP